ncbi:MAG TPA: hypothetical protein VNE86_02125 [Nitrososphaerales archaeon]|nr:hypothetical protein [Nitrososphaerales archaeon]
MKLIALVHRELLLKGLVETSAIFEVDEDDDILEIRYPDQVNEQSSKIKSVIVRDIEVGSAGTVNWFTDLKKEGRTSLQNLSKGFDSPENRESLRRELEEINKLSEAPGFQENFKTYFGYTYENFLEMTDSMLELIRKSGDSVYAKPKADLVTSLRRSAGRKQSVGQIVQLLTASNPEELNELPIIEVDGMSMFNGKRVLLCQVSQPEYIFDNFCDSNFKGRLFERRVRDILLADSVDVYPKPIEIIGSFEPTGKKSRTDIDVIAKKDEFVFVTECKEQKFESRHPIHNKNIIAQAKVEIYHKAVWLADESHVKFHKDSGLSQFLDKKPIATKFIPLVVTNNIHQPESNNPPVGIINPYELSVLVRKFEPGMVKLEGEQMIIPLSSILQANRNQTTVIQSFQPKK